jgi:hypothetical protein
MLIRRGEQKAEAGTYWDISTGERITIQDQEMLPGNASTRYIKASSTMVVLLGPVLGLIFAIFMPFIGIAMAIFFAGKKVVSVGKRAVQGMVAAVVKNIFFAWRPLQAYLAKRRGGKREKDQGKTDVTK